MSESISTKVPKVLKKRFEIRCNEISQTKSEVLKRLVSEFVDGNDGQSKHDRAELAQQLDEMVTGLSKTVELVAHVSDEIESAQADMRNLVASLFRVLIRNPKLLTEPDQFSGEEFRNVLKHIGLGDVDA